MKLIHAFACSSLLTASLAQPSPTPQFQDVTRQAGLTVPNLAQPGNRYVIESTSGGVGFIDCDNDGRLDIVTVNGSSVDHYRQGGDLMLTLYHQTGDLKFTDITQSAGLTRKGYSMGVAVADFDNDGWQDLYVTGYGGNVLYRNLGNCRFDDVTDKAGARLSGYSTGAAWGDYDRDGNVDLFIPRYLQVDINKLSEYDRKLCDFRGVTMECARRGHTGDSDVLLRNRGNGTFEDVSQKAGVSDPGHYLGMQGIWSDYDNDGWPDLYVTNDGGPNFLYHNKHDGTFEEIGLQTGVALSLDGQERAGMGVDIGDFDHDGLFDFTVTNFSQESNALYWNQGQKGFTDIAASAGIARPSFPPVGWGTAFFDMDNDGWLDLIVANGHVYPQMDLIEGGAPFREPLLLFRNKRDRTFEDVTALSGLDKLPPASRRGLAVGDVNNDGKLDVVLLNIGEPPTLLINRTSISNHAVLFHLIGTKSNKAAIGAKAIVTTSKQVQIGEIRSGSSYLSQNDLRLHFGLLDATSISSAKIVWPDGKEEIYKDLPADFIYTIVEETGIKGRVPFTAASPVTPR
ncbi:MAG: CRTAC1 family protein [Acidobacteria bacterium]|nr:CRTAC1 family protein [Acidobacteriota bacterium]